MHTRISAVTPAFYSFDHQWVLTYHKHNPIVFIIIFSSMKSQLYINIKQCTIFSVEQIAYISFLYTYKCIAKQLWHRHLEFHFKSMQNHCSQFNQKLPDHKNIPILLELEALMHVFALWIVQVLKWFVQHHDIFRDIDLFTYLTAVATSPPPQLS